MKSRALDRLRILVVDDAADNLELLGYFLAREGAIVDLADDGDTGVAKARQHPYDLILMDIEMPRLNGYGALERLRANGFTRPVYALTGHDSADERERIHAAGFAGHVAKPIHLTALVDLLAHERAAAGRPPVT